MTGSLAPVDGSAARQTDVEKLLASAGITAVSLGSALESGHRHTAVLVADEDIEAARRLARRGGERIHFFSGSGRKGGAYRLDNPTYRAITMAVFPLCISSALLEEAKVDGGVRAETRHRLALYVKAYFTSNARLMGLSGADTVDVETAEASYSDALTLGLDEDRFALHTLLASVGWQPPVDMLERLGLADPWIATDLLPELMEHLDVAPGLAAFFCRAHAVDLGFLDTISRALEEKGFQILSSLPVEGEIALKLRDSTRGGNWGSGPYAVNGGAPKHMIFAVDVFPVAPAEALLGQHPFLDNENTLTAKLFARDAILAHVTPDEHFNPLHSSDNSSEALRLAELVLPQEAFDSLSETFASTRRQVDELTGARTMIWRDAPVAATFSTEVPEGVRFRKIFRPQYSSLVGPVSALHETLSADWPEVPKVFEQGDGWIDFEIPDTSFAPLGPLGQRPSLSALLRLRRVLHEVQDAGFVAVDWDPARNLCVSRNDADAILIGFDTVRHATQPDVGQTHETQLPHAGGGQDAASWVPLLGVSKQVLLSDGTAGLFLSRNLLSPALRVWGSMKEPWVRLRPKARAVIRSLRG